jgi:branched-chain amino acid transport system ATP-binding protein
VTAALYVDGLAKSFGGLQVARDIGLTLDAGARHALIGPNGAGKSTLVGMLSGVIVPDAGRVQLFGADITGESPDQRVKRGLVRTFQVSSLFGGLTVFENVFLAVSEHAKASVDFWRPARRRHALIERSAEILRRLNLASVMHRRVTEISYGQQRLVEIAIAMSLEPKVLLLDEPAAGVPGTETGALLAVLEKLPADIAILIIEHDMQIVRRFATQVTVLVQGSVLMTGSPIDVMSSDEVRKVYLGTVGARRFSGSPAHA